MPSRIPSSIFWHAALALLLVASATAATYQYGADGRYSTVWIPDTTAAVRGIMVFGNGAGGDSRNEVNNSQARAFCNKYNFALMATGYFGNLSSDSEWNILQGMISQAAASSSHLEINNAPYLPIGFSNGGQMAYAFMYREPEKTIAFCTNKGAYYINGGMDPPTAGMNVPGLFIAGGADTTLRRTNIHNAYLEGRQTGGLWAWTEEANVAHAWGSSLNLLLSYYDEVTPLRYPMSLSPTATQGVGLLSLDESSGYLISDVLDGRREGYTYGALPSGEDALDYSWMPTLTAARLLAATVIPEPGSCALLAIGLAVLSFWQDFIRRLASETHVRGLKKRLR